MKKGICISATNLMKPDFDYKAIKNSGVEFVNLDFISVQNESYGIVSNAQQALNDIYKAKIPCCLSIAFRLNSIENTKIVSEKLIKALKDFKNYPIILDFSCGTYSPFLDLGKDECAECIKIVLDEFVKNGFITIWESGAGLNNDYYNVKILSNYLYYSTSGEPACRAVNMEDVKVINASSDFGTFVTTEKQEGVSYGRVYKTEMYTDLFEMVKQNKPKEPVENSTDNNENAETPKEDNSSNSFNNQILEKISYERMALLSDVDRIIENSLTETLDKLKKLREILKEN